MARTYEPIASTTLSSTVSDFTFTSIPGTYTDLILVLALSEASGNVRGGVIQVGNGSVDTGTNYSGTYLHGSGSAASSARLSSQSNLRIGRYMNVNGRLLVTAHFMSYANTNVFKTVLCSLANQADSSDPSVAREVGLWRSTSAITDIKVFCGSPATLASGSVLSLYGVKAA